ncbi:InlB B-repeat-containing protein [Lachnospiraceae bacterium ASD3451]|uniref:InlB B-repeat-containing protein n=1 Tax=Diplocloster agilis TaxID=2850323 RepID=UPI001D9C40AF|nr:InlB B-repeat-containing protein [Diplocloster agilis]MBU9744183.1 InlB B-repeat-containing protein [Diplocloster agilis]
MKRVRKILTSLMIAAVICTMYTVPALAYSGANYGAVSTSGSKTFNMASFWAFDVYSFTPSTTGCYEFYSYNNTDGDPFFYLVSPSYYNTVYNSLGNTGCRSSTADAYSLAYNDDGNGGRNFKLQYLCYAGQTYYCFVTKYNTNTTKGSFAVSGPYYNSVTLDRNGGSGGSSILYNGTNYGNSQSVWLSTGSSSAASYITAPTRTGYTFSGYYGSVDNQQYIASNGAILSGMGRYGRGTLVAQWSQNVYTLTLSNQGVANTSATVAYNTAIPESVAAPVRAGYQFEGYYSAASGGTQYYNSAGKRVSSFNMTSDKMIYAQWTPRTYNISYQGLTGAVLDTKPAAHTYGTATTIPDPVKTDYTFTGWTVNGGTVKSKNLTLAAAGYTADISLTANWVKRTDAVVQNPDNILISDNISQEDLANIFHNPSEESKRGVTQSELNNSDAVRLTMTVSNITGPANGEQEIKEATNGEVVRFFDVKVVKEVTPAGGGTVVTTNLVEVPEPIEIRIPLSGDLSGKSSYQVLRYHSDSEIKDGQTITTSDTQAIPQDGTGEYFTIEGNNLVIHTRLFSTYAIAAGQTSLDLTPVQDGGTGNGFGTDVQGRIVQTGLNPVYKLDVSWGPMVFEYTTAREWDPNNHVYLGASYSWAQQSFQGGNNRIILANHSNADVNIDFSFAASGSALDGVDVTFKETNADTAPEVTHYFLPKVPAEAADAPSLKSYLWLSGTPRDLSVFGTVESGGETPIQKVGVITVTAAADPNSTLTPKNP